METKNENLHSAMRAYVGAAIEFVAERAKQAADSSGSEDLDFYWVHTRYSSDLTEVSQYKSCFNELARDSEISKHLDQNIGSYARGGHSPSIEMMNRVLGLGKRDNSYEFDPERFEHEYVLFEETFKYLLVIDEINRANIAKVFGELITLLEDDKRLGRPNELRLRLPYSGDVFGVPPNLYILGTMNTADRSIALLDLALRRRFSFMELMPDSSLLNTVAGVDLNLVLTKLNERVALLLDRYHQIGHSYFLGLKDGRDLHFAWYHRVVPLLQEYFYNDGERLYAAMGDGFLRKVEAGGIPPELNELIDTDTPRYELRSLTAEELVSALQNFLTH